MKSVFVDSDAFVALVKEDDTNHSRASAQYERLKIAAPNLCTSNYVFAEVVTVLSQRVSREIALKFIASMRRDDSTFATIWVDEEIEKAAIEIFKRQSSKNVSFVDCTNMAIAREQHIDCIFSFDDVYRKNEFNLLETFKE